LLLKQQWKCKIICHFVTNGEHFPAKLLVKYVLSDGISQAFLPFRFVEVIVITDHDLFWNVGQANCILKYFEMMSSVSCCARFVNQNNWPTLLHDRADVTTRYICSDLGSVLNNWSFILWCRNCWHFRSTCVHSIFSKDSCIVCPPNYDSSLDAN
jgi:hypothetical protein